MNSETSSLLWTQKPWLKGAHAWIDAELKHNHLSQTGEMDQFHIRPWSTVIRIPTETGDVYFKAVNEFLKQEAGVTKLLTALQPKQMPRVLSVEEGRGWLLLSDGGTRLRQTLMEDKDITIWERILPQYAAFQVQIAPHIDKLLAKGADDRRLATLSEHYANLLANTNILLLGFEDGITDADYAALKKSVSLVENLSGQLASFAIPESLEHGDLHDGNIFVRGGRYYFFDWGDCSITHPFFSMRTTFVSIEGRFGYEEQDPRFEPLIVSYLKPWEKFESPERLDEAFRISQRLAPILAALRWAPAISVLDDVTKSDYAVAIPSLLREFLSLNRG